MRHKSIAIAFLSSVGLLGFLFTAAAQPLAVTLPATGATFSGATLNGLINPLGGASLGYFEYGPTTDYGCSGGFTVLPATNVTLPGLSFFVSGLPGAAGETWTDFNPIGSIAAVASAADGLRVAAAVGGGHIFTSTNGGVTWTEQLGATNKNWSAIASSADGVRLAAAVDEGRIFTSTNGGVTWTEQLSASSDLWSAIASSADGLRLVAAVPDYGSGSGGIYTSTNGGVNWTKTSAPNHTRWADLASSADGLRLAAVNSFVNGGIWTSMNGGVNWTRTSAPTNLWYCITSSADGRRLAAGNWDYTGEIWTSTDGGATWTPNSVESGSLWTSITSSADGARLAATKLLRGDGELTLYTSTNGGADWTLTSATSADWNDITSSADGARLVAAYGSGTWTSAGPVGELVGGRTYHYRLVGVNSAGTGLGGDQTFTLPILKFTGVITPGPGSIFRLNFSGSGGLHLAVLATTNLALPSSDWTTLGTMLEIPAGEYRFADVNVPDNERRYYRLRLQ